MWLCIAWRAYLDQNHGRDLLGGELLGLTEVLNLDLGVAVVIDDLERPGLLVLLDGGVIVAATDQSPACDDKLVHGTCSCGNGGNERETYLTSKTVLTGFMAAWFLAASPINRSSAVKDTKEGVVKEPCSLAMISTLLPS